MKPIPKELQAYFPNATDPARPWWTLHPVMFLTQRQRVGGIEPFTCREDQDRERIDKGDPLPPPPILVGQVWAAPLSGGRWRVSVVVGVVHESDGTLTVTCANDRTETGWWLYTQGFLLTCPFGYAPWSGPEVP